MIVSWGNAKKQLVAWSKKTKRAFIFTEIGYPSLDGCAKNPWDYTANTAVDLEEQRRAYSAFVNAWSGVPQLVGVFFWDWYGDGGPKDKRYTPRGKPASEIVRKWYGEMVKNGEKG